MLAATLDNNFPLLTAKSVDLNFSNALTQGTLNSPNSNYSLSNTSADDVTTLDHGELNGFGVVNVISNAYGSIRSRMPPGTQSPTDMEGAGFDWFERIIVSVPSIELGAFIETEQEIGIYSTFREQSVTLNSIDIGTGDGTNILGVPPLPFSLAPQSGINQIFQAIESGASTIDGDIVYNFSSGQVSIAVSGSRTVILPWEPNESITEKLEWRTDVLNTYSGETRRGLREAPRRTIGYSSILTESEHSDFLNLLSNQTSIFTANCFWDTRIASVDISQGDFDINVDTEDSEFIVGQLALIHDTQGNFEVREIKTI